MPTIQPHPPSPLPYATPPTARPPLSAPLWLKIALLPPSLFLLAVFLIGLPPLAGAIDYTRTFTLTEVLRYDAAHLTDALGAPSSTFAPLATLTLLLFLLNARLRRITLITNVVLPLLYLGPYFPFMLRDAPQSLLSALTGRADGETWSEGFVSLAALACWTPLWLTLALTLALSNRRHHTATPTTAGC
ncbi:MAG: hypothetical protein ACTHN5_18750 [Phycisphaerae bacterium]